MVGGPRKKEKKNTQNIQNTSENVMKKKNVYFSTSYKFTGLIKQTKELFSFLKRVFDFLWSDQGEQQVFPQKVSRPSKGRNESA